jgi:hypothetical protein
MVENFLEQNLLYLQAFGELAQLARASRWQREGRRFDSDILHNLFIKSVRIYYY